jgi:hypothetical protein
MCFPGVPIFKILNDYNHHFSDSPALKVTYKEVANKFSSITKIFSRKWRPNGSKGVLGFIRNREVGKP